MKKIVALVVAALLLSCVAFAEPTLLADYGTENTVIINREVAETNHVTAWEGQWTLVAAYMSEDAIDEYELEADPGFYAMPENMVVMELKALLDASANDPATGPIVDQANYWHAHTHDLEGVMTVKLGEEEEEYKITSKWDQWNFVVRGEQDGDFNYGPAKVSIKGEDDEMLRWNELTGFDFEEIEEFKFMGMNADGQLLICSATKNLITSEKAEVMFAYIFDKVVPAE